MYYDTKKDFYIKQYGPAAVVTISSIVLILSGVFIYVKSTNSEDLIANKIDEEQTTNIDVTENILPENENINDEVIETNNVEEESNALVDETKSNAEVIKNFESLLVMQKSTELDVLNINESGTITVKVDCSKLEITLIGIDFKYSNNSTIEKMKEDLLNKKVQLVFDNVRMENNLTYAYIYCNNTLYNAELLKTGLVTLKTERNNIQLNNILASAQAYARENSLGVWNK